MKIAARVASLCSLVVLAALLGLSIFEGLGAARGTWRVVPVLSGSMSPLMPTGSAVLTWKKPIGDLHVGTIVAYAIPVEDHHVEMHRVVSLKRTADGVVFHTKGDANNGVDPWAAVLSDKTFWSVGLDVPMIGYPIVYLQRPLYRLAATLAAAFGFLLSSRRRQRTGSPEVVDVEVAEAVVGALEDELAEERGRLRGEIESLVRRLDTMQDEDAHQRRMHEVDILLTDLRLDAQMPEAASNATETISLLHALEQRVAAVRAHAGTTGLAA
jgi:signal peptidase I